jgi:D-alanyl-D-alanine endopeptidase (penicillin-binding protein 7)
MAQGVFLRLLAGVAAALACGSAAALEGFPAGLKAATVLVVDDESGEVLYGKNALTSVPIASISKLMTAIVTLDAALPPDEPITIGEDEIRATWPNHSRLEKGATLTRDELLHLALLASDNRAAVALGRSYPGGLASFVEAMNRRAEELGMVGSHFQEPSGLSRNNVSTAEDLVKLVHAARDYPLIAQYSTDPEYEVTIRRRPAVFRNTNPLVRAGDQDIAIQKTGFTNAAGQCLVMYVKSAARTLTIVLLDSFGRYGPVADALRIRSWIDPTYIAPASVARLVSPQPGKKAHFAADKSRPKPPASHVRAHVAPKASINQSS